jgi:alpha-L-fucosidase
MKMISTVAAVCMAMIGFMLINHSLAQAPPTSAVDPDALKRWRDARFGMFIHWDPISQLGKEISWSRAGVRRDYQGTGNIPPEQYDNLYKTFNPVKFDADKWVEIAKAAGMKYLVIVAKHHDGFCMFDSQLTDYKITNTPFKRDVCAELAKACHDAGISLGFYYSPPDWHNPDFFTENQDRYIKYMHGQVRELLTNYGQVDILWFDSDSGSFNNKNNNSATWDNATLFPMIRQLQPQILTTKRCGGWGDFNTPEQTVGTFDNKNPWESCITISAHNHWSWGGDKDGVKPLETLVRLLVNCAGGDGNMLLNVGPQANGEINAEQVGRLKEVGAWIAQYGESIYDTRGGPYKPGSWGASTCKENSVYLHIFNWGADSVMLPPLGKKILRSELLAGGAVHVNQDEQRVTISVAPSDRQEIDTVVKLELDGPASDIPPISDSIASGKTATASSVYQNNPMYAASKAFDDDSTTRWATDEGTTQAWLEVDLGQPLTISRVKIDETYAGRVQSFELQYKAGDQWQTFYSGTTIGADFQTSQFKPITAQQVRLNILQASKAPTINELQLFNNP